MTWFFTAASNDHEDNDHVLELYDIVAKMREGKNQFLETYAKRSRAEEWPALMIEWLQQLGELYNKVEQLSSGVAAQKGSDSIRRIICFRLMLILIQPITLESQLITLSIRLPKEYQS
ncbi:hypothetical protein EV1_021078 [Malus domestica]